MRYLYHIFSHTKPSISVVSLLKMAISNLLATINAVSFFSGKPDHFLARPLSQTTPRIQTSCCHREPSFKPWTPIMMSEVETYTKSDSHGVGIFRFLQGKSYLITGATGFLAKGNKTLKTEFRLPQVNWYFDLETSYVSVLIEKLVRESPEIGNIFILMKTQDQESANKRLYDEVLFIVSYPWALYPLFPSVSPVSYPF